MCQLFHKLSTWKHTRTQNYDLINFPILSVFVIFRKYLYQLRHVYLSVRPSAWNNSTPTGRIFVKFDICLFFEYLSRKFKFHYNRTRITGTLREELCTILISRGTLLAMRNVSDKSCRTKSKHTFDVH
jgi:hypothetical protein